MSVRRTGRRLRPIREDEQPRPAGAEPDSPDRPRDIVVVGASAGGVQALVDIAEGLPADFGASLFVVLHLAESAPSALPQILDRAGPLPAQHAVNGERIERGVIYVAPPDHHLLVRPDGCRVLRGPKVNRHRPAVDVLFHSAARAFGRNLVGVVLTGARSDGALGLRAIKRRGGIAVVQEDPEHEGMPTSALAHVDADFVVPLREIAATLTMLVPAREEVVTTDEEVVQETDLEAGFDIAEVHEAPGDPSVYRCPECGGAMWEVGDGEAVSYACHVGHTFSEDSMVDAQGDQVERAIWSAVRLLEERAVLVQRLAERTQQSGLDRSSARFTEMARTATEQAALIRRALLEPDEAERAAS
jgi:two-component system chemotaxis response regulator CheB